MDYCLDFSTIRLVLAFEMSYLTSLLQIVAAVQLNLLPAQSSSLVNVNSTKVMLFQEVWGKSFCRTIEKLVEVVQEYPGEVEHIFSPACVPLVRCAGCCGDENLECHPTLTSNTTMQLLKIKPAEQGQEYVEMTFVEHKACEYKENVQQNKTDGNPEIEGEKERRNREQKTVTGASLPVGKCCLAVMPANHAHPPPSV
ncbi:snake venom vascular endothelial growth factor toxin isoform X1 [Chanodichthys erythropterus]|uniref:snake venom vascular endothelial growth factor toxin isoform X1 n=1 Tax=Chanodichthys erythropterus TaxID=933992 RepID=UPI00351EC000